MIPSTAAPPTLAQVIAYIESGAYRGALRFEPTVYARVQSGAFALSVQNCCNVNRCSIETGNALVSFSFGEYQIMGFNLYGDVSFTRTIAQYLSDATVQLNSFVDFVLAKKIAFSTTELANSGALRSIFAVRYNGSIEYVSNIEYALRHFGMVVV